MIRAGRLMSNYFLSFFLLTWIIISGCKDDEVKEFIEYDGPLRVLVNAEILHSEESVIKARILTSRLIELESGDQEMPEGVELEFFDEQGEVNSTLKADYAYYNKEDDLWKATGDVELINFANNEKLNSEELFWDPQNEKVFTEKFVRIESDGQIIMGEGMDAAQDFSTYKIHKPTGELTIDEV